MDREAIHAALAAKAYSVADFQLKSRRLKFIDEMNSPEFPACFVVWKRDIVEQEENAGEVFGMFFEVWVYVDAGGEPDIEPVKGVIAIVDKLHAALKPVDGSRQTLGGLVYTCKIEGEIETDGGVLGAKSIAIIPIKVVTTD
jgi:hypothetical protein